MRIFVGVLLSVVIIFQPFIAISQTIENLLNLNGEVYLKCFVTDKAQIAELGRIVSIDKVKDNEVIINVGKHEWQLFKKLKLKHELIESPFISELKSLQNANLNDWNVYPTLAQYYQLMIDFQNKYPAICQLDTIGFSIKNKPLLCVKISDRVHTHEAEPAVFLTSSMHGDETTGYILMLRLIDYLLSNYEANEQIADMVDNTEIWINPLSNPDGTYTNNEGTLQYPRRRNANNADLNRNFPDPVVGENPDGAAYQPETLAMIEFMKKHKFNLSVNFHGGAEVVNYPWDSQTIRHADDLWYQYISRQYADTVHQNAPIWYMDGFDRGITNGIDWYILNGGRQDYMNYFLHGREVTIELDNTKLTSPVNLPALWNYNYKSLLNYIEQAQFGIRGRVTDIITGTPIEANIEILNYDKDSSNIYSNPENGNYHRFLIEGNYNLKFSASGYRPATFQNIPVKNKQTHWLNVQMLPSDKSIAITDSNYFYTDTIKLTTEKNKSVKISFSFYAASEVISTNFASQKSLGALRFDMLTDTSFTYTPPFDFNGIDSLQFWMCTNSMCDTIAVIAQVGNLSSYVAQDDILNGFSIFPNPSSDKITVSTTLSHGVDYLDIEIYNALGVKMKSIKLMECKAGINNSNIQINDLETGVYLIFVSNKQIFNKIKFVKY